MNKERDLEIQSILSTVQHEDHMEFEITLLDGDGNVYVSRFTVRNHNVGFFNRALRRIRPVKVFSNSSRISHGTICTITESGRIT